MIGFGRTATSCAFCGRETPPEELHELTVPFPAEARFRVCGPCRDDHLGEPPDLVSFDPGFRGDTSLRWVGPIASDGKFLLRQMLPRLPPADAEESALVAATLAAGVSSTTTLARWRELVESDPTPLRLAGSLTAAIAAGAELLPLDRLQRLLSRARRSAPPELELLAGIHAHAAAGVALSHSSAPDVVKTQSALLQEAKNAYLLHGPSLETELDARVAALGVALRAAEGRFADAKASVERIRRDADPRPELRDPRIPMLHALSHMHEGNLAAVDRALAASFSWVEAREDRADFRAVEAALLRDLAARAFESMRWKEARDALKLYCRLEPADRRALLDLGHAYVKVSERAVAREVLESALGSEARADLERLHAEDKDDEDGILLYATCLARLGEVRLAFATLEEDLVRPRARESLRAERCHLAGLCAFALGKHGDALALLVDSFEIRKERHTAEDLVAVLRPKIEDLVERLTPESVPALAGLVREHAAAIRLRFGTPHLIALLWFLGRELEQDMKPLTAFGMVDPAIAARFGVDEITTLQAYLLLAQRKLVDAVRRDREARAAGAPPIPFRPALALLASVRTWSQGERRELAALLAACLSSLS